MAEIFEKSSQLMPEWANEGLENELVKAVDKYEAEKKENRKNRFVSVQNSQLSQIIEKFQSSATNLNTKWVINIFEGKLFTI